MNFHFTPRTNREQAESYVRRRYGRTHFVEKLLAEMSFSLMSAGDVRVQLPNAHMRPLCVCCQEEPGVFYCIEGWPEYTGSGDDMVCGDCGK